MKVLRFHEARLGITTFDDRKLWVHVDVCRAGCPARTVFQSRAELQLSDDDLAQALRAITSQAEIILNEQRKEQGRLLL